MNANSFLAARALGGALSKEGATHHSNANFTYYVVESRDWETLYHLTVKNYLLQIPLTLSEHAPHVSRLFIDLDTNKGECPGMVTSEEIEDAITLFQNGMRRVPVSRLTRDTNTSTPDLVVVLRSNVTSLGPDLHTYHLVWPFLYMDRRDQVKMFNDTITQCYLQRMRPDTEATGRGSLRGFLNDSCDRGTNGGRPFVLHGMFDGEGTRLTHEETVALISSTGRSPPTNEEVYLIEVAKLTSLLPTAPGLVRETATVPVPVRLPVPDMAPVPVIAPRASVIPASVIPALTPMEVDGEMGVRETFLTSNTSNICLRDVLEMMEEVWQHHSGNDKISSAAVEREMADRIVPYINRHICAITHHSKAAYIVKLRDHDSRFPLMIHKSEISMNDFFDNGGVLRAEHTGGKSLRLFEFNAFKLWKHHPDHLTFSQIVFKDVGTEVPGELNIFRGLEVDRLKASDYKGYRVMGKLTKREFSVQTLLDHQFTFFCCANPIVYSYFIKWQAHRLQFPLQKSGVCLIVLSHEGVGKDLIFTRVLGAIIGRSHFLQTANLGDLAGQFNANLEGKILVVYDEAGKIGPREQSHLQTLITETDMRIERKCVDAYRVKSAVNVIINSNQMDESLIKVTAQARRWVITRADSSVNADKDYFVDLINDFLKLDEANSALPGVNAYADFLYNIDLEGWNPREIPVTEALIEFKLSSMPPPHQWAYECLSASKLFNAGEGCGMVTYGATDIEWGGEWIILPQSQLWNAYVAWCRRHCPQPGPINSFITSLRGLIGVSMKRPRAGRSPGGAIVRTQMLHVPPLFEAKAAFMSEYRSVRFDDSSDDGPLITDYLPPLPDWHSAPDIQSFL